MKKQKEVRRDLVMNYRQSGNLHESPLDTLRRIKDTRKSIESIIGRRYKSPPKTNERSPTQITNFPAVRVQKMKI